MRWAALAVAALLVGLVREVRRPPAAVIVGAPIVVVEGEVAVGSATAAAGAAARGTPPPRSLAGTEVDGALSVDEGDHLVVDEEVRRLFDYFLTASGEVPIDEIRARLAAALAGRLPEPAAGEARALFERYLDYRAAAGRAATGEPDVARGLAAIEASRVAHLGAAAEALFASEQTAPLEVALATAPIDAMAAEGSMAPDAVAVLRERRFGAAGAVRLRALDDERARFAERLASFRAARRSGGDVAALLEAFTPAERMRVATLERLAGAPLPAE